MYVACTHIKRFTTDLVTKLIFNSNLLSNVQQYREYLMLKILNTPVQKILATFVKENLFIG